MLVYYEASLDIYFYISFIAYFPDVFKFQHENGKGNLTFKEAQKICSELGDGLASKQDLKEAHSRGYECCRLVTFLTEDLKEAHSRGYECCRLVTFLTFYHVLYMILMMLLVSVTLLMGKTIFLIGKIIFLIKVTLFNQRFIINTPSDQTVMFKIKFKM